MVLKTSTLIVLLTCHMHTIHSNLPGTSGRNHYYELLQARALTTSVARCSIEHTELWGPCLH